MIRVWFVCLLVLSDFVLAEAEIEEVDYQSIRTLDSLFMVIDSNAKITRILDQGVAFTHYYDSSLNRSFIVDNELSEVCRTYTGTEVLSCFPCAKNEVSKECP